MIYKSIELDIGIFILYSQSKLLQICNICATIEGGTHDTTHLHQTTF
jgi:hypothetical protein